MAVEPIVDGRDAPLGDLPDELIDAVGTDRGEEDFWTEADRARGGARSDGRARRHRARGRKAHAAATSSTALGGKSTALGGKGTLRTRAAAAWAAEVTAMRALRTRPVGAGAAPPDRRHRKAAAAVVGVVAVLALLAAIGEAVLSDGPSTEQAAGRGGFGGSGGGLSSSSGSNGVSGTDERTTVPSRLIDAPSARTPVAKPKASKPTKEAAAPTTVPKSKQPSTGRPSGSSPSPAPITPAPAATANRPTAPPTPTTAPPTTAPKPPAAPRVQGFTATTASRPGGACSALQWATTFAWSTSNATSVAITGLLEPTLSNLPAGGSKVVCRALPAGPAGGWTLTATGPGGNATAKA